MPCDHPPSIKALLGRRSYRFRRRRITPAAISTTAPPAMPPRAIGDKLVSPVYGRPGFSYFGTGDLLGGLVGGSVGGVVGGVYVFLNTGATSPS